MVPAFHFHLLIDISMLHRITTSIEIFYRNLFTGNYNSSVSVSMGMLWCWTYLFFYTWCFLCCCSPRLGKYYSSNLQSLSSSATFGFFRFKILMSFFTDNTECTCRLKLGCFSTFQLLIFWLPKCLFCLFSHADFRLSAICSIFLPSPYMSTFEFFLLPILITSCRFWSPHVL